MSEPGFKDRAALRDQLLEKRGQIVEAMLHDGPLPNWLMQLAGIAAALDAFEEEPA